MINELIHVILPWLKYYSNVLLKNQFYSRKKSNIISDRDRQLFDCDVTNPKDAGKLVSEGKVKNFYILCIF